MKAITHACGTPITVKREPGDHLGPGHLALWCPQCRRWVRREETDAKGALSVAFEKAG